MLRKIGVTVLAVLLAGCIKIKVRTTVHSDGSGKMEFAVGVGEAFKSMIEQMKGMGGKMTGGNPFADLEDLRIAETTEGFSAWTRPKKETKGNWDWITVVGYFEDINAVKIYKEEKGAKKVRATYAFQKIGGKAAVEIQDSSFTEDEAESDDETKMKPPAPVLRQALEGFEYRETLTLPGTVESVKNFDKKEGRTASLLVDVDKVIQFHEKPSKEAVTRKVVSAVDAKDAGEIAAFKKEFEEAKREWAKIREEKKGGEGEKKDE